MNLRALRRRALYLAPVALLGVLASLVQAHGQIPYTDPHYVATGDHARYLAMAEHPFSMEAGM